MNTATATSGRASPLREAIDLVSNLWDIECRHQLGKISRAEYRQAVAALRGDLENGCPTLTKRKNNDD
jgi:hypothetical protein